jgi:hypothetical protein
MVNGKNEDVHKKNVRVHIYIYIKFWLIISLIEYHKSLSEVQMVVFNMCVILGTVMAIAYDLETYITCVPQRNRSVVTLNYETEVCMKEEYSIMINYWVYEGKCI